MRPFLAKGRIRGAGRADYTYSETALAATPGQKFAALQARSRFRAARADYAGAIADLRQALPLAPRPAGVEFDLGRVEARQGDRQKAVLDLGRAVAIQPTYAAAYRLRAELRGGLGDATGAAADLTMARELGLAQLRRFLTMYAVH